MAITEQQLTTLIDLAVREAVDRTTKALTEEFEKREAGLRKNRDELLSEKKELAALVKNRVPTWEEIKAQHEADMAALDERLARIGTEATSKPSTQATSTPPTHLGLAQISREDARDTRKYREAREAAARDGLTLKIVDLDAVPDTSGHSRVKFLQDKDAGVLYANKALVQSLGISRLQELAAQKRCRMQLFKSTDDLPTHVRQQHAEIERAGKPDAFLLGDD
jgi:hypothetical protein